MPLLPAITIVCGSIPRSREDEGGGAIDTTGTTIKVIETLSIVNECPGDYLCGPFVVGNTLIRPKPSAGDMRVGEGRINGF